jgi:aconitate hydratase
MTISVTNSFKTRDKLNVGAQAFEVQRLELLEKQGVGTIARLPFSLRILLENLLRCEDGRFVHADDIKALATWTPGAKEKERISLACRRSWIWLRCARR